MKKLMDKIRKARTWQERAKIAQDKLPGTSFDPVFEEAQTADEMENKYQPITRQCHERLGKWLAEIILNRKTQVLYEMADALASLKRHKPKRNYDLEVLFSMSGLFPPGWTKRWITGFDPKSKLPIRGLPAGTRDAIAVRDIKQNLARLDPNFDEDKWETRRRKIQRYAKEFEIPLDDTPGRPAKESRRD